MAIVVLGLFVFLITLVIMLKLFAAAKKIKSGFLSGLVMSIGVVFIILGITVALFSIMSAFDMTLPY